MVEPTDEIEQIDKAEPKIDGEKLRELGTKWLDRINGQMTLEKSWRNEAMNATAAYAGEAESGKRYTFNILYSNVETIVPAIYNSTPAPDVRRRFGDKDPVSKSVADLLQRGIALQLDNGAMDSEIEAMAQDAFISGRGIVRMRVEENPTRVAYEVVPWRDYVEGPAKRWKDVPWQAFRQDMHKDEAGRIAATGYVEAQSSTETMRLEGEPNADVTVWEVWCKKSRKVYFIRDRDGMVLSEVDDPLGLPGFFSTPEPTQPITVTGRRMPVTPFSVYRELADELDLLTKRINKITSGIKARGAFVAGEASADLEDFSRAEDNSLTEIRGVEMATQAGGLDKLISWWPIEQSAQVLAQLSGQREQVKQAIYELTGISDIVRGASNAQETASAQQIKSQWGSLRIKKMQRQIEATVRDLFQMTADVIARMFDPMELSQATGVEIGQEAIALLQQPVLRLYRIDVESDSTVRADVSRNQGEMNQFLQGTAQFIQAVGPAVQGGVIPKDVALEIYSSFARSFKLGKSAEDVLESMSERAAEEAKQPDQNEAMRKRAEELEQGKRSLELEKREALVQVAEERASLGPPDTSGDDAKLTIERERIASNERMAREKMLHDMRMARLTKGSGDDESADDVPGVDVATGAELPSRSDMMINAIAQLTQQMAAMQAAQLAPKTVTTPDGRSYTLATGIQQPMG